MINDLGLKVATLESSIIGDDGFTAILGDDCGKLAGIIGAPRVDPTGSGFWIEDSYAAVIDAMLIALLADFVKRGIIDGHVAASGRPGPPGCSGHADELDCLAR